MALVLSRLGPVLSPPRNYSERSPLARSGSPRVGFRPSILRQRVLHPDIQEGRGAHGPVARRRRGRDRLPAGDGGLSRMTGTGREGAI